MNIKLFIRSVMLVAVSFFGSVAFIFSKGTQPASTISVFIPNDPNEPLGKTAGGVIMVPQSSFYSCRRMLLQPQGGDVIAVASYYYLAEVLWQNEDGSSMMVNNAAMKSNVYLAVTYDAELDGWRDISGIGADRAWPYSNNYFVCAPARGGERLLQAFAAGASPKSYIYDHIAIGASNIPVAQVLSPFDTVILNNPQLFFKPTGKGNGPIVHFGCRDYIRNTQSTPTSCVVPNTLSLTAPASADTVVVKFLVGGAAAGATQEYNVPRSSVFAVINQYPNGPAPAEKSDKAAPSIKYRSQVLQSCITVREGVHKTGAEQTPEAPVDVVQSYAQSVSDCIGMVLADYYLHVGDMFIAINLDVDITGTAMKDRFVGWAGAINPAAPTIVNPSGVASMVLVQLATSLKTEFSVFGVPYLDSASQASGSLYLSAPPVASDGSSVAGFVVAASAPFFKGQCSFTVASLSALETVTKDMLTLSSSKLFPYGVYAFALNSCAVDPNYMPIMCKASDGKTFPGLLAMKTDNFGKGKDTSTYKAPQQYYQDILAVDKFQIWYATDDGMVLQLATDLSGSLITEFSLAGAINVAAWPAGLLDKLKKSVQTFIAGPTIKKISGWQSFKNMFTGGTSVVVAS